jgi:7,8-dihydropterin-6-yl-methyl-4-(beta-D-ribofuranosyl)aminobenzene 5'-phosphate synthase
MTLQLDIVCENTVGRPISACGEHGFACLLQTPAGRWLFDTGSGDTLLTNLAALDLEVRNLDGIIISHGHYDHCGGLLKLLRATGPRRIYAHRGIFGERFWKGQHEQRNVSLPFSREELEDAGADFVFMQEFTELAPGIHFSGEIPRIESQESGDPHLVTRSADGNSWAIDKFADDTALALDTAKGLVILLGCAHAGLINTLEWFRYNLGDRRIHAIVGGTHLGPAGDEQFAATVEYLRKLEFDRLGVSHCTGQIRAAQLYAQFPNKVFFASVGASLKV